MELTKTCSICKIEQSIEAFNRHANHPGGRRSICKSCTSIRHKEKRSRSDLYQLRIRKIANRYGITDKEVDDRLAEQNFLCKICQNPLLRTRFHADHNHKTNQLRGFLCGTCNSGLGMFKENPDFLRAAIEYLNDNS